MKTHSSGNLPLTVSLQNVVVKTIKARSPPSPHLVSLPPSDIMLGGAFLTAMVAVFWPSSPAHDEEVLNAGLSAALDGYPIFVGRLQAGGKVCCVPRTHCSSHAHTNECNPYIEA